jgi:hypothetical protein
MRRYWPAPREVPPVACFQKLPLDRKRIEPAKNAATIRNECASR